MTRINVVDPIELTNAHLMAEYRELPRVFTDVRRRIAKGQTPADIAHKQPTDYKLGQGHVMFFLTRCGWLMSRYEHLCAELLDRGYNLNLELFNDICDAAMMIPREWWGDYDPTDDALLANRERIADRLAGL